MSRMIVSIITCNGCGRSNYDEPIEIAQSLMLDGNTVDLCRECEQDGKVICPQCRRVHDALYVCLWDQPNPPSRDEILVAQARQAYFDGMWQGG